MRRYYGTQELDLKLGNYTLVSLRVTLPQSRFACHARFWLQSTLDMCLVLKVQLS